MKLLYVGTEYLPVPPPMGGGAEKFAYFLATQFERRGHEVCVLSLPPYPESELRTLSIQKFPGETLASRMAKYPISRFLAFRASEVTFISSTRKLIIDLLKKEDFDIIHCQTPASGIAAIIASKDRLPKKVITSHGYFDVYRASQSRQSLLSHLGLPEQEVQRSRENWALMHSDLVTAVSNSLGSNILKSLPALRDNLEIIHAQVPIERYEPSKKGNELKARYAINDRPTILYAGRINRSKGVIYLVKAMSHVIKAIPNAILLVVGPVSFSQQSAALSDGYANEVTRAVIANGLEKNVVFTGHISNEGMLQAYAAADIVVVPSVWQEPCSVSILEGMATGRPVVATRVGGNPELVIDRETGHLVPPFDVRELARRITELLVDPGERMRLGMKGRMVAQTKFSCEAIADKMERAYASVSEN